MHSSESINSKPLAGYAIFNSHSEFPQIIFNLFCRPKIGKSRDQSDALRRHTKGCNCKRSGCLKNYCECYEAKIVCSGNCKCIGKSKKNNVFLLLITLRNNVYYPFFILFTFRLSQYRRFLRKSRQRYSE